MYILSSSGGVKKKHLTVLLNFKNHLAPYYQQDKQNSDAMILTNEFFHFVCVCVS